MYLNTRDCAGIQIAFYFFLNADDTSAGEAEAKRTTMECMKDAEQSGFHHMQA